jgi:hypothetical protein
MRWTVILQDDFHDELGLLAEQVQDEMLAHANLLAQFGPHLGRPTVDTLKASRHPNMKELRLDCECQIRWAFGFAAEKGVNAWQKNLMT